MKNTLLVSLLVLSVTAAATPTLTVAATQPPKKNDGGLSRGTTQVKGGDGVFGVVYTLQSGLNFEILSAKYTIEPHNDYEGTMPTNDEKLVWITFAVKNSDPARHLEAGDIDVTLVDDSNQNYQAGQGHTKLNSRGSKSAYTTLKPGQGVGQDPVKDELSCAVAVPASAKIVRIILNQGRKNVSGEKIMRYNIAGFPGGSPKNAIAPLPKYAADPTDPTGATVANPATAVAGKFYPDGYFAVRFDGITLSTDTVYEKEMPKDGKQYAIATFTAKNIYSKAISTFELFGQTEKVVLRDGDGEKYPPAGDLGYAPRRAKQDEPFDSTEVEVGETVTYRYFFEIPKDAKPASLTYGQSKYGHAFKVDLTAAQ